MKRKQPKEPSGPDHRDEIKRLNRIIGQVDGVRNMLEEQRRLKDVLIRCKAIHAALRSIERRIFKNYLDDTLDAVARMDKRKNREQKIEELEELFGQAE